MGPRFLAVSLVSAALVACSACGARRAPPQVVDVPAGQAGRLEPGPTAPDAPPKQAEEWHPFGEIASGSGELYGPLVGQPQTDLEPLLTPFLARGEVFRAIYMNTHHPVFFHVGVVQGKSPQSIATPAELVAFARAAGLVLDREAARAAYVKLMLSLTTSPYTFSIESVSDFPFTVPRDPPRDSELYEILGEVLLEEARRRRDVEDRIGPRIKPLRLTGSPPWSGIIHMLKQDTLVAVEVMLEPDGELSVRERELAEHLPVTWMVR